MNDNTESNKFGGSLKTVLVFGKSSYLEEVAELFCKRYLNKNDNQTYVENICRIGFSKKYYG